MNKFEAAQVLTIASGFDNRRVDDLQVEAFREALADVDYEAARAAVVKHYAESRAYLMPADIRALVRAAAVRHHVHRFTGPDGTCTGGDGCVEVGAAF